MKAYDEEFDQFVGSAWPRLRQAAFALTGHTADAEDLLQGVLARAYAGWPRIRRGDPVAYVRRALVNAYIDTWRRRQRIQVDPVEDVPDRAAADLTTDADVRADLRTRLGALSQRERSMVVIEVLPRPDRAGGRPAAGLLDRHREEHLLAGDRQATTRRGLTERGRPMNDLATFQRELDQLDTGLPAAPDLGLIRRAGRRQRRRRHSAQGVVGALVAVGLGLVAVPGLRPTLPFSKAAGFASGSGGTFVTLGGPGWRVGYVSDSDGVSDVQFDHGAQQVEAVEYPASEYDSYVADRSELDGRQTVQVLGREGTMWTYAADDHTVIRSVQDGHFVEIRGTGMSESEFRAMLGDLALTDEAGFAQTMPDQAVTPQNRVRAVARLLQGVDVPPGFTADDVRLSGFNDAYPGLRAGCRLGRVRVARGVRRWLAQPAAGSPRRVRQQQALAAAGRHRGPGWVLPGVLVGGRSAARARRQDRERRVARAGPLLTGRMAAVLDTLDVKHA